MYVADQLTAASTTKYDRHSIVPVLKEETLDRLSNRERHGIVVTINQMMSADVSADHW